MTEFTRDEELLFLDAQKYGEGSVFLPGKGHFDTEPTASYIGKIRKLTRENRRLADNYNTLAHVCDVTWSAAKKSLKLIGTHPLPREVEPTAESGGG